MSSDSDSNGPTPRKRKNHDLNFKLEAIEAFEANGNKSKTAKQFGVKRQDIQKWNAQKEDIREQL